MNRRDGGTKEIKIGDIPKIQNSHAILQTCPLYISVQHFLFRLFQALLSGWIKTARILHPRSQAGFQDARPDLVMLLICLCRFDCNGSCTKKLNIFHLSSVRFFERGRYDLPDTLAELGADAITNHGVREITAIQEIINI